MSLLWQACSSSARSNLATRAKQVQALALKAATELSNKAMTAGTASNSSCICSKWYWEFVYLSLFYNIFFVTDSSVSDLRYLHISKPLHKDCKRLNTSTAMQDSQCNCVIVNRTAEGLHSLHLTLHRMFAGNHSMCIVSVYAVYEFEEVQ